MKSPFPGMDPYLEQYWGDVHHRLIQYSCDVLQPDLPDDLRARVEERVFLETDANLGRFTIPDLHIAQDEQSRKPEVHVEKAGGIAVAEPLVFDVCSDFITEGYIEIREGDGGKVITLIEFLSPTNKLGGTGQRKYLEKQDHVLDSDASLVEIDLVRKGRRVLALPEDNIPEAQRNHYLACVSPGWHRSRRLLYTMPLRQRLPALPIPLREKERPLTLDLQPLLDRAFSLGRYGGMDYRVELDPPLSAENAAWAAQLLQAANRPQVQA